MSKNSAYTLIIAVLGLVSIGLVILTSVGAFARGNNGEEFFFVKRQAVFLGGGLALCLVAMKIDYHRWIKFAPLLFIVGVALMLACFLPHIGVKVNGAHRWLRVGPVGIQPMEIAKLGFVVTLAWWFGTKEKLAVNFKDGVLKPLLLLGMAAAACALQKDIGTAALLLFLCLVVMFVAGVKCRWLGALALTGLCGVAGLAFHSPQKWDRVMAFLHPEKYAGAEADQLINALIALGSGGLTGLGLGKGVQKMKYLAEAQTDFIFPNIGEELGVICTLTVVFLFLLLVMSGGVISLHAKDKTGLLIGIGVTSLIGMQGLMNLLVTTGLMPTKGIGLPFISYGGTNLLLCFGLIGILLNIHFQAVYETRKNRPANVPAAMTARM
ncbi:MAG: putative lipid II flippase FtsW [Verrucomicrobiales bacterium]|jgi:cell division protein FtsW|nr:putative lipid II flippase FtsW [Verrucomicrobiales bacterium]